MHLIALHPKLIFRRALKKALMVIENRSDQTQYFGKIFPSPSGLTLHIDFYLHFQESFQNALWIVLALTSAFFSAPDSGPKNVLEIMYFTLFSKSLTKIWNKS